MIQDKQEDLDRYVYSRSLYHDLIQELISDEEVQEFLLEGSKLVKEYMLHEWHESKAKLLAKCTTVHFYIAQRLFEYSLIGGTVQNLLSRIRRDVYEPTMTFNESIVISGWLIDSLNGHLYDLVREGTELLVKPRVPLSQEEIDAYHMGMYQPPRLNKPMDWDSNSRTVDGVTDRVILGSSFNYHEENLALDVLNILQGIQWSLDPEIVLMEEEANKDEFETQKELDQWLTHKEKARYVYNDYLGMEFFFEWKFDKRGRQYSQGYHINIQSTGFKKASLTFGEEHLITGEL